MESKYIAGMSIKGGRNNDFFFCLLEYFEGGKKLFVKSLLKLKDEDEGEAEQAIKNWVDKFELGDLVVDCPLSSPVCENCAIDCPGACKCPQVSIVEVRKKIKKILEVDRTSHSKNPKKYENERNKDDEIFYSKDILSKDSNEHILSRSFKRRLGREFLPYWNRALDFWIWCNYHDQLLELFKMSFDSFGNTSLMLLKRFNYLRRHIPETLSLHEANVNIVFIEFLRAGFVSKYDIFATRNIDSSAGARLAILRKLERKMNLFIYDQELEILMKNPKAFNSFILALAGHRLHLGKIRQMPIWTESEVTNFILPIF
ncbi:MAG: hypothetical protein KAQ98_02790 [Bacteriovoracaceae bacterium]|nr:hypothetical protein [Bacteriovoracaceae bacterium]